MKKSLWLVAVLLCSACVVAAQDAAVHADGPPKDAPVLRSNLVALPAVNHLQKNVYINNGQFNTTVSGGVYTPVDALTTVTCPGTTGKCTIQADTWIATGNGSTTGNEFAACTYVDGVQPICFYEGSTPSDSTFVIGSFSSSKTVTHGTHTVQTFIYSNNGAFFNAYNFTYRVYKP